MNQFKKFCTGSETNCTKGKTELQHLLYTSEMSPSIVFFGQACAVKQRRCSVVWYSVSRVSFDHP